MHKTRPPPLSDSYSLSLSLSRRQSSILSHASNTQTLLVPLAFSPSLSLSLCVCVGGSFQFACIYTPSIGLSRTLCMILQSKLDILGALIVRTQIPWLVARNSLTHHSVVSELSPSLSNSPSTWVTHTHAYLTRTRQAHLKLYLSPSFSLNLTCTHTHTISCLASQV